MPTNPFDPNDDKLRTDEAWKKLQSKLGDEPAHPRWASWPAGRADGTALASEGGQPARGDAGSVSIPAAGEKPEPLAPTLGRTQPTAEERSERRRGKRRRKWVLAAASACLFGAILATPVGNNALAAILNQFRMQEMTVVKEDELMNLFNRVTEGQRAEALNRFGTFTNESGALSGPMSKDQIAGKLGFRPAGEPTGEEETFYVIPSQTLSLRLDVDEVNKAMKRLGASMLLPASIGGKPITLNVPETVSLQLRSKEREWASFTQSKLPTVTVDPSIPVEEALDAVLQFPLLPDHLKTGLQKSKILAGELPVPVVSDGVIEQITLNGTKVLLQTNDYGNEVRLDATWVKDGRLYSLNGGNVYMTKEAMLNKIKELMAS
ncbi:hypothetical protein J31TS4_27400 [Paenibacillus sp. J31TS4]|uniref:hypothetical protein n=1 Tax=Paenibacillus sp. J31TS4 TaxID=2807195 RepID=UPI001B1DBD3B|nr:hypothetical protein [Paenibacillus sp. J31TS4]GIP39460.1 hypothetical protein J31TS4_27400 [Paenibacillus sp. J31TS4]